LFRYEESWAEVNDLTVTRQVDSVTHRQLQLYANLGLQGIVDDARLIPKREIKLDGFYKVHKG
jgi:hypothetical protein